MINNKYINKLNNRLVFTDDHHKIVSHSTDIGFELAKELEGFEVGTKVALIANAKLHELFEKGLIKDDKIGDVYCIRNIGILFEPELKIDFVSLCRKYSRDSVFVVEHHGEIDAKNFYFLTTENGKKIELTDLNYTIL